MRQDFELILLIKLKNLKSTTYFWVSYAPKVKSYTKGLVGLEYGPALPSLFLPSSAKAPASQSPAGPYSHNCREPP